MTARSVAGRSWSNEPLRFFVLQRMLSKLVDSKNGLKVVLIGLFPKWDFPLWNDPGGTIGKSALITLYYCFKILLPTTATVLRAFY